MKLREASQVLGLLERGSLMSDLTSELAKVIAACQDAAGPKSGAKGVVSLKLNISVEGVEITFDAELDAKLPKRRRQRSTFFVGADGVLSTEHPNQIDLFPRDAANG